MDYDFSQIDESLKIPPQAYRAFKRCPNCHSVFITDKSCESCGRSLLFHPVGDPFGPKSFYGLKERYLDSLNPFMTHYHQLENKQSTSAKSYIRNISKRFSDLISGINTVGMIPREQRKHFYIECIAIIDELLLYGTRPKIIEMLLSQNDNSLLGQELIYYLQFAQKNIKAEPSWSEFCLNYRLWGTIRLEFLLKVILFSATVLTVAVKLRHFFN